MIGRISATFALLLALPIGVEAQTRRAADTQCLQRLHRDQADLPAATRQARAALIANPGRIDVVAARAARASERERAEIELGILRAAEWLRCIDPYGYQALEDYMRTHAADPVIADLTKALNAEAAAGGATPSPAEASANAGGAGSAANPGSGLGSFAVAGPIVSPSH
jgi:hypothetical protein